jgi:DNA-binding NtrC family response regulator
MHRLLAYPWPGNVRELFNKVKYATAIAKGAVIEADDLFASYDEAELKSFRSAKDEAVKIFERQYLNTLLRAHEGNVAEASETAGVNRTNLYALLRRNNIDPAVYKMNENGSAQE